MATKYAQSKPTHGVYTNAVLNMKVHLMINEVGKNIKPNLESVISQKTEGKCIKHGFIKPNSIRVLTYSSGILNGGMVIFDTVFECKLCNPVEGMHIDDCVIKTVTKAGIHAEVIDQDGTVPLTIFIARDHHFQDKQFSQVTEGVKINVSVIGTRYELNDPYICVIAKLLDKDKVVVANKPFKPKSAITILED